MSRGETKRAEQSSRLFLTPATKLRFQIGEPDIIGLAIGATGDPVIAFVV